MPRIIIIWILLYNLMIFIKFTKLYNHHQNPILERAHHPNKISPSHLQLISVSTLSHGQPLVYFLSLKIFFSGNFI